MNLTEIISLFEGAVEQRKQAEAIKTETMAKVFEEFGEPHIAKEIRERGIPKIAYIHTSHQGLIKAFELVCEVVEVKYKFSDPEVVSLSWKKHGTLRSMMITKPINGLTGIETRQLPIQLNHIPILKDL